MLSEVRLELDLGGGQAVRISLDRWRELQERLASLTAEKETLKRDLAHWKRTAEPVTSKLYSIGEAAVAIGRSTRTLLRWEEEGTVEPSKDGYGRRYFTAEQVERLKRMAEERRGGLALRGA